MDYPIRGVDIEEVSGLGGYDFPWVKAERRHRNFRIRGSPSHVQITLAINLYVSP